MKLKPNNSNLKIHILDVGHGDSIIIEFPNNNSFGIIDCCRNKNTNRGYGITVPNSIFEPKSLTFFRELHSKKRFHIEFVCLTHPHFDHYKGYFVLLNWLIENNIEIKEFWDFGSSSRKLDLLLKTAKKTNDLKIQERANELDEFYKARSLLQERQKTEYRTITSVQELFWKNESVEIDTLSPNANQIEKYNTALFCKSESDKRKYIKKANCKWIADDNILSSAFLLKYGNNNIILGGDTINVGWLALIDSKLQKKLKCNIVKVSHHGSLNGCFPFYNIEDEYKDVPIWAYMDSKNNNTIAVISGGYRAGLPHKNTLESLDRMKIPWFCTGSVQGENIAFIPNGIDKAFESHFMNNGIMEVVDNFETGSGDITITCFEDGEFKIDTEKVYR